MMNFQHIFCFYFLFSINIFFPNTHFLNNPNPSDLYHLTTGAVPEEGAIPLAAGAGALAAASDLALASIQEAQSQAQLNSHYTRLQA